jgi:polysaccharide biosynthesis/export protein ExoF
MSWPVSGAQDANPEPGRQKEPSNTLLAPQTANGATTTLGMGDRLKISFFEVLDVAGGGASKRDVAIPLTAVHTFYQRMDLSGEYSIEQDGAISFPRLGQFQADGRGLHDLQSELVAAFTRITGRSADVTVTIIERSPVYVLGPVKNPGSYKYVPGMMALHAVALAGGIEPGLGHTANLVETIHEMERLKLMADGMKRLLARRARLEAEHHGEQNLQPSAQLIALAGEHEAQFFMAVEGEFLQFEQLKRQQQRDEASATLDVARNELDILRHKLSQFEAQKKIRTERLEQLEDLMNRGLTTRNGVVNSKSELADIEVRKQDHRLAIAQAEARLSQARQAMKRTALDGAGSLLAAITTTDAEIAKAQMALSSSEALSSVIKASSATIIQASSSGTPTYEIVRQTVNGPVVLPAFETSSLKPGDVLKITLSKSKSQNSSGSVDMESGFRQQVTLETTR